ncbi:MAG: aminopeptidase P family protein [Vulcanimicrobiota bacterium]
MSSTKPFSNRRSKLADLLAEVPVLLLSGCDRYRNYLAYTFPFRASSHYLFFGAPNEPGNFLLLHQGEATLYRPMLHPEDEIWHGAQQSEEELRKQYDLKSIKTHQDLAHDLSALGLGAVCSLPSPDAGTNELLKSYLGRVPVLNEKPDTRLVEAIMELRLCQDESAIGSIRKAVHASAELQLEVMKECVVGATERELRGVLDKRAASEGWELSFSPIISVAGEVLHNPHYRNRLADGDMLLVDCGAELSDGYVGDLTRTYPVNGTFSETQKAIYEVVDAARAKAVSTIAPGVHFAELHRAASLVIAEGLVGLGILKGEPQELVEKGAHALFFCHGLGHLLGLDAHDMEDFGDRVGYEEGTGRSPQFGLSNLRLSRTLQPGMVVTIEPGYYSIPALLNGEVGRRFESHLDRETLKKYDDVRGIRIEDVVLVTAEGFENLSGHLPTDPASIEKLIGLQHRATV